MHRKRLLKLITNEKNFLDSINIKHTKRQRHTGCTELLGTDVEKFGDLQTWGIPHRFQMVMEIVQ